MITLSYSGTTLTLPAPTWGNTEYFDACTLNRRTQGQTLKIYRYGFWPTIYRFSMTWNNLTKAEALSLDALIQTAIGKEITVIDSKRDIWRVIPLTIDNPVTQSSRGYCGYTLEAQGIREASSIIYYPPFRPVITSPIWRLR